MKIIIILIAVLIVIIVGGVTVMAISNYSNNESVYNTTEVEYSTQDEIGNNPIATVKIEGMDEMKFVLFPEQAPQSVYNFISLANSGFYEGLTMHRIVTDFVAQGGDKTGTGGGPTEYNIKGEFPSNGMETGLTHKKGAIAWARSSEYDSAGTQFYICLDDVTSLDYNYAVFGYMIEGASALEQLQEVSSPDGTPTEEVIIKSVTVDTKGVDYPEPDKL